MKILLVDGSSIDLKEGATAFDLAEAISQGLARNACAARINGEGRDLRTELHEGDEVEILKFDDPYGQLAFNHTASHLMAEAILRLYPQAKLAIGPAIRNGFYYDVDFGGEALSDEDLPRIEREMEKIRSEKRDIRRFSRDRQSAIQYFEERKQPYKVALVQDIPQGEDISFYDQGGFVDLCAGPHLMNMGQVKAFKLTSLAGAYWRGDEKQPMLTRIYGTAFPKKSLLEAYLKRVEEAKRRDHRKIGKEMGLFAFYPQGPGFPFWLPRGMALKNALLDYWREIHLQAGYQEISTPIILSRSLWETSGHWDHYRDNMYTTKIDEEDYAIKPMNCPGSMLVYKGEPRSYRDLPLRYAELGLVHRHEKSGELHGLFRVRSFTQDDGHIYIRPDQVTSEIAAISRLIDQVYKKFGFQYTVELSTRPEDSMGSDEDWENATNGLIQALDDLSMPYTVNEGDGAFYGPKIDFHLQDSLGREWQCGTIQLDFQLPQRFEAEYTGEDGEKHRPILIHRVILGSVERFIGNLIEETEGNFPLWLAPVQVKLIPVNVEAHAEAVQAMAAELRAVGIREETDLRDETLGKKIREAQLEKCPYLLVIGDKEIEEHTVTLRQHGEKETVTLPWEKFKEDTLRKIQQREMD